MALHEQLRTLVDTHGASILEHAEGFRAALDDFLTEDEATVGEVNLLVDAVRLGSVQRLVSLLDHGAAPEAALSEAAAQLARDRDTAPDRARWALSLLGYALGRIDTTIPAVEVEDEVEEGDHPAPSPVTVPVSGPVDVSGVSTSSTNGSPRRALPIAAALVLLLVIGGVVTALAWPDGDGDGGGRADEEAPSESADNAAAGDGCPSPTTAPVDDKADEAAVCLAGRFDQWAGEGKMLVGQQVNLDNDQWKKPLESLAPARVGLVGFDFKELANAADAGKDRVPDLIELADQGYVLTASWHADNPWSGGDAWDPTDNDKIEELVAPGGGTSAYDRFWHDWDQAIAVMVRLRDAGVPLIVRPLHEANAPFFWWGHQAPDVFQELWSQLRTRVEEADVHNVLWHFAAAPKTWEGIQDPLEMLPEVDFAGLDTYDCEQPGTQAEHDECGGRADYSADLVELASYAELQGQVPRMSLSEVGPQFSFDGSWDPSVVTTTAVGRGFAPAYAMFWFDDQRSGRPPMAKQLSSLQGTEAWLSSCPEALCDVSG